MQAKEINGLKFVPYITREKIEEQVKRVADEVKKDAGGKNPVFLCVLNGSFIFAADLLREAGLDESEIVFIRYKSYEGTSTSGKVKQLIGLPDNIEGKDIYIIEDIVDTGLTARKMVDDIVERNPASVKFITLLHKPESSKNGFKPDFVCFSIPPKFIVGYGLDLDEKARNLKDIYIHED